MIKLIVAISLIFANCCLGVHSSDLCKLTGTTSKSPPDILSLVKGQTGYTSIIEIVEWSSSSQQFTNQFKDVYDSSEKIGSIEWLDSGERSTMRSIHYYFSSLESFIVNNGSTPCTTKGLAVDDKRSILYDWMSPSMRQNFNLTNHEQWTHLTGIDDANTEYLGPTVLMIIASSLFASSYNYMGQVTLDGFTVDQWSMCLSPSDSDLVVDTYFLASSHLPNRFVISSQSSPSKAKTLVNFLTYDPILPTTDSTLTFPIGYGCTRAGKYDNLPTWATTDSYLLDMEAAISFDQPERLKLSSMKLIKHQSLYSYQISQSVSNITRIIKTPSLLQYFQVNPRTGFCSIEYEPSFYALLSKIVTTQWPLLDDYNIKYTLLSPDLFTLDGTNFLGTVKMEYGSMKVFEKVIKSFYTDSSREQVHCLVQFYFPATITQDNHQPPHHVIIKPFSSSTGNEVLMDSVPSRIEITYVDYQTDDDVGYDLIDPIDYANAFDVSGCYDEPGQYTWFQLLFPDTTLDIMQYQEREATILHDFTTLIESLIPLLRLSDTRVTIYGPNIYITCKLLQAETSNFISMDSSVLSNPTELVIREYMEDCSELCLDSEYCTAFAHCGNMECFLFADSASDGKIYLSEHRDDCTLYASLSKIDSSSKSQVEINLLKSSKNILHQLKRKLDQGQLVLPSLKLSASDLFIIKNPDEIGGVDEELTDDQQGSSGDNFEVLIANQRFTSGGSRSVVLNYQSCLSLCDNDDDCYTLSYCPSPISECVIMNKTTDQVQQEYRQISSYIDGCNILSKSFLSFYRKFPGRSLILDAITAVSNVQPDECARQCSLSTDFDCQSFDYCPQVLNNQDKKSESACFLHALHVSSDSAHELDGTVWDFSNAECDHYSRQLSKDYQHLLGHKLRASIKILEVDNDVSLEGCAFQCNDLAGQCVTFEYCESVASTFTSTCRLTNYIPSGSSDDNLETSSSSSLCSIYVNQKSTLRSGSGNDDNAGGVRTAFGLGAFFFISAFAVGTIASHLYIKKYL